MLEPEREGIDVGAGDRDKAQQGKDGRVSAGRGRRLV